MCLADVQQQNNAYTKKKYLKLFQHITPREIHSCKDYCAVNTKACHEHS
jgi:hypothetical protein